MAAPITLATAISAPAETISEAISTAAGLASFWTTDSKAEPKVGSVAVFGFGAARLEMRVDEVSPGRRIAWTCLSDFPMSPFCWEGTTVSWDVNADDHGETRVLLQHGSWPDTLPQAELASTAFTWALILRALKAYAETGTPQPVFAMATH